MLLAIFRRDYELITLQNKLFAGKLCMHSRIITEAVFGLRSKSYDCFANTESFTVF